MAHYRRLAEEAINTLAEVVFVFGGNLTQIRQEGAKWGKNGPEGLDAVTTYETDFGLVLLVNAGDLPTPPNMVR